MRQLFSYVSFHILQASIFHGLISPLNISRPHFTSQYFTAPSHLSRSKLSQYSGYSPLTNSDWSLLTNSDWSLLTNSNWSLLTNSSWSPYTNFGWSRLTSRVAMQLSFTLGCACEKVLVVTHIAFFQPLLLARQIEWF